MYILESNQNIDEICEKYGIQNYTINPDGSIDVDDHVSFPGKKGLSKIPLKFNKVLGKFLLGGNELTSLEGSPKWVGQDFLCFNNYLTDLKGGPEYVGRDFFCHSNLLTSLEGCPKHVEGSFYCDNNNLTSLEHIPEYLGDIFHIPGNPINCLLGYDSMGVEMDLLRAFKSYKIIKDGVINLKRLRYLMQFFDFDIDEEGIKNNYIVK
tara:strand:+ start:1657 stop:2280 length:624 start_codon:yes stop_codon:yes gene_type:complete